MVVENLRSTETLPDRAPASVPTDWESRRRYLIAVLIGIGVTVIPYLWVLCDLWTSSPSLLRTAQSNGYAGNFYDLQARAMFHGHFFVANGALGEEAFVHGGHQYTYFGIFPSILRMPLLLVTSSLDGRLSAPSTLLAWSVTAIFVSLLVWRIRIVIRGPVALSRTEAAGYGVLVANVMGGSVLLALASSPWVFTEDVAWSVALTIGSVFTLLGVLERPSWGRVAASGALILAANLTRGSTGYACVLGAFLVAVCFAVDRKRVSNRRWVLPVLLVALIALAASCLVDYAKFGILFGLAASDQVIYTANHFKGSYFGVHYLPSTLLAYFGTAGLRLTSVFPFITYPTRAHGVGGITLWGSDWIASVPTVMPLLFILALWGTITTVRPNGGKSSISIRIVLATAAAAGATVMVFGWIANRFVGDLVPVLVVGSAIGMVDLWRRLSPIDQRWRRWTLVAITALGLFGIAANIAFAVFYQTDWSTQQDLNFGAFQNTVSGATGHPLRSDVMQGDALALQAPRGQLFIAGDCDGLYISNGLAYGSKLPKNPTPFQKIVLQSLGWAPVERGTSIRRTVDISIRSPLSGSMGSTPLATIGGDPPTVLTMDPSGPGAIQFAMNGPSGTSTSKPMAVTVGKTYRLSVVLDTYLHSFSIAGLGREFNGNLLSAGPVVIGGSSPGTPTSPVTVSEVGRPKPLPPSSLCQRLR